MHATPQLTVNPALDGVIDPGIEQEAPLDDREQHESPQRGSGGGLEDVGAEAAAHAALRLTADHPGQMGRLRTARIVGGYSVPHRDEETATKIARYAIEIDWSLRELVNLIDALIDGRLIAQTSGPRPVLVLTRAGYAALVALEGG